jgi:hypothetical protein
MTTELAVLDPATVDQMEAFAKKVCNSILLPEQIRGKPADVLIILLTGRELGLSQMQSIRGFDVVKGVASMKSALMVALVKKHPKCIRFKMLESSDTKATYETEREGEGVTKLTYTIEQAGRAGLLFKDNWKLNPAAMLRARCAKALATIVYPEITFGLPDPDEAEEFGKEVELNEAPRKEPNSATNALKAELSASNSPAANMIPVDFEKVDVMPAIVDVQAGETEAEATARTMKAPTNWEQIVELGALYGMDEEKMKSFCRAQLGSRKKVTPEDVRIIQDAISRLNLPRVVEGKTVPPEPPPPTDADAPPEVSQ